MKYNLPTKAEWNDAGFTVPDELCDLQTFGEYYNALKASHDRLLEACHAACLAAADCLPPSGNGDLDPLYYKAKLLAIDEAAAKCSSAITQAEALEK